jgi:hypothetical protein
MPLEVHAAVQDANDVDAGFDISVEEHVEPAG